MHRAVFLDRDGTINDGVVRNGRLYPPPTVNDFRLLPGVDTAVPALARAGFKIVVVTNQPDVATGVQSRDVVETMHERLREWLPIDDIRVCYHVDADACACRKPKPGMLLDAAVEHQLDLRGSYMIGDRWRDVGAGTAAGCRTIWVRNPYEAVEIPFDLAVDSLKDASDAILDGRV
jgi:D-glycero-D-manno-heptose 1,7-bisphosphate phosphatase